MSVVRAPDQVLIINCFASQSSVFVETAAAATAVSLAGETGGM